jgi:hypothetical protein
MVSAEKNRQPAPVGGYLQPTYRRDDTAGLLRALYEDGFALIPGVFDAATVAAARAAIDRLRPFHWDAQGLTDHYKCVFNRDPSWLKFLDPPGIIELAEAALGSDCHIIGQTLAQPPGSLRRRRACGPPGHGGAGRPPGRPALHNADADLHGPRVPE